MFKKRRETKKLRTRRKREERKVNANTIKTLYSEMVNRHKFITALDEVLYACDINSTDFNCQCIALDGIKGRIVAVCKGVMATTRQVDLPPETLVIKYEDAKNIIKGLDAVDNIGAVVELVGNRDKLTKLKLSSADVMVETDLVDGDFPAYRELMKPLPDNMFILYKPLWMGTLNSFSRGSPLGDDSKVKIIPTEGKVEIEPEKTHFNFRASINTASVGVFEPFMISISKLKGLMDRIKGDRVHIYRRTDSNMIILTSHDASSKLDIYNVDSVHIVRV